jgi:hypothetical protein
MKTPGTDIIRRESIQEITGHRDCALDCYRRAAELIADGNRAAARAGARNLSRETLKDLAFRVNVDSFVEDARKELDAAVWIELLRKTALESLMDADTLARFRDDVHKNPPEMTVDNVVATMTAQAGKAHETFAKGVIAVFRSLSRKHRTNDAFKIGKRAILAHAVTSFGLDYGWKRDTVNDIDRIFHVMDGKPWSGCGGLVDLISKIKNERQPGVASCETEYFKVKWFQNGNLHLEFKRADLVERVNMTIAAQLGEVLADGRQAPP